MILTGPEIIAARERGDLVVEPFDPRAVEPNDYLVRLGSRLLVCTAGRLDARVAPEVEAEVLPESGRVLQPGQLYLGETAEVIGGRSYASTLDTARSVAELGLWIQVMAPLGHVGAVVRWTLELVAAQPLRVYPGMPVGKIAFWVPLGPSVPYQGRYLHSDRVHASRLERDFRKVTS